MGPVAGIYSSVVNSVFKCCRPSGVGRRPVSSATTKACVAGLASAARSTDDGRPVRCSNSSQPKPASSRSAFAAPARRAAQSAAWLASDCPRRVPARCLEAAARRSCRAAAARERASMGGAPILAPADFDVGIGRVGDRHAHLRDRCPAVAAGHAELARVRARPLSEGCAARCCRPSR